MTSCVSRQTVWLSVFIVVLAAACGDDTAAPAPSVVSPVDTVPVTPPVTSSHDTVASEVGSSLPDVTLVEGDGPGYETMRDLLSASSIVAVAEVMSLDPGVVAAETPDGTPALIVTPTHVRFVDLVYDGAGIGDRSEQILVQVGGSAAGVTQQLVDQPVLMPGTRTLLFARQVTGESEVGQTFAIVSMPTIGEDGATLSGGGDGAAALVDGKRLDDVIQSIRLEAGSVEVPPPRSLEGPGTMPA